MRVRRWIWVSLVLVNGMVWGPGDATAKRPDWVEQQRSTKYSDGLYLQGVGLASSIGDEEKDRARADSNARAEIAKQIRVRVESVLADTMEEKGAQVFAKTYTFTKSSVDLTLEGVQIVDRWVDTKQGLYYALAVLERRSAGDRLRSRMERADAQARAFFETGEQHNSEGAVRLALEDYFRAEEERVKALNLKGIRAVVAGRGTIWDELDKETGEETATAISIAEIESQIGEIVAGVTVSVASGDDQRIGYGVEPQPVSAMLSVHRGDSVIPMPNVPVAFAFESGKGRMDPLVRTDARGRACARIYEARPDVAHKAILRATVAGDSLLVGLRNAYTQAWIKRLKGRTCRFTLRFEQATFAEGNSLDEVIDQLSYDLGQYVTRTQTILIGAFRYRNTEVGGEFASLLQGKLAAAMTRQGLQAVTAVDAAPVRMRGEGVRGCAQPALDESYAQAMGKDLTLTGRYWDLGDTTEIMVALTPSSGPKNKQVTRRIAFPSRLVPSGVSLKPANVQKQERIHALLSQALPSSSGFDVKVWLDRPGGSTYAEGDTMVVYVLANRDSFVRLVYHDANGDNFEIFPNSCDRDTFVRKNTLKVIGGADSPVLFKVSGPPFGVERVWAYASTRPLVTLRGTSVGGECTFLHLEGTLEKIVEDTRRGAPVVQRRAEQAEDSVVLTTVRR